MIKHEEAKQRIMNINIRNVTIGDLNFFTFYITEQEKKDERNAKELELLGLYREKDNHIENWENYDRSCDMGYIAKLEYLQEQIKALEEEGK